MGCLWQLALRLQQQRCVGMCLDRCGSAHHWVLCGHLTGRTCTTRSSRRTCWRRWGGTRRRSCWTWWPRGRARGMLASFTAIDSAIASIWRSCSGRGEFKRSPTMPASPSSSANAPLRRSWARRFQLSAPAAPRPRPAAGAASPPPPAGLLAGKLRWAFSWRPLPSAWAWTSRTCGSWCTRARPNRSAPTTRRAEGPGETASLRTACSTTRRQTCRRWSAWPRRRRGAGSLQTRRSGRP
mmetsp:Transcript_67761/g.198296  ORF Transcript_67761/g.198296 Transcript_67761/m.198296 type:complete len:239 (+) Transcript_67761:112-828(+)